MIELVRGNILAADAEAIVNTVNCLGVMGKGLTLQFKKAHPENFEAYRHACAAGEVQPGRMFVHATGRMTVPRALLIKLMDQYAAMAYRLTLSEIQKLAYFLQEAGQPLRLQYTAGHYGPYAPNLNKVLEALEGHYTRGYGDSAKPDVEVQLLEGTNQEADAFLAAHQAEHERLERVSRLISGFETPYGMELLASVHWLALHGEPPAVDAEAAIQGMASWNDRKRRMLQPEHIRVAWERLDSEDWLQRG